MATIILPEDLSMTKRITNGEAKMYGINSTTGDARPLVIEDMTKLGTMGNYKSDKKLEEGNPANTQICRLATDENVLRIIIERISFDPLIKGINTCSSTFVEPFYNMVNKYHNTVTFEELAHRYFCNIVSGRWTFQNGELANIEKVKVEAIGRKRKVILEHTFDEDFLFDNAQGLEDFSYTDDIMKKFEDIICKRFSDESERISFRVTCDLYFEDEEVHPSELFINKSDKSMGKTDGRHLYQNRGVAAMSPQKIGNGIRTIDTWYPNYNKVVGALPVNPYAPYKKHKTVYRNPNTTQQDFYTLLNKWLLDIQNNTNTITVEEMHFVMACFIRGGMYSAKNSNSES